MTPPQISGMFTQSVKILKKDSSEASAVDKLGTGCSLVYYYNGVQVGTYNIIVYGDLSGDGKIEALDYMFVKRLVLGNVNLTQIYNLAADVDLCGKVDPVDLLRMKKHMLGNLNIFK